MLQDYVKSESLLIGSHSNLQSKTSGFSWRTIFPAGYPQVQPAPMSPLVLALLPERYQALGFRSGGVLPGSPHQCYEYHGTSNPAVLFA